MNSNEMQNQFKLDEIVMVQIQLKSVKISKKKFIFNIINYVIPKSNITMYFIMNCMHSPIYLIVLTNVHAENTITPTAYSINWNAVSFIPFIKNN